MKMVKKISISTISSFVIGSVIYYSYTSDRVIITNAEYEFDINKKENIIQKQQNNCL